MSNLPPKPSLALSINDIAEQTTLTPYLVTKAMEAGDLPYTQVGPRRVSTPEQVDQWLRGKARLPDPKIHKAVQGLSALGIEPCVIGACTGVSTSVAQLWAIGEKRPTGRREKLLWELLQSTHRHAVQLLDKDLVKQSRPPEEFINIAAAIRAVASLLTEAGFDIPSGTRL